MRRLIIGNTFAIAAVLCMLLLLSAPARSELASWINIQPKDALAISGVVVYHKAFNLDFNVETAYLKFTCYTTPDFRGTTYRAFVNNLAGAGG